MIHLLDLLTYVILLALGALLMRWADETRERAVKAERDRAESWKAAYTTLRYDTKPYESPEVAPAPLQLNPQDAWAMRCNGQVRTGRRA